MKKTWEIYLTKDVEDIISKASDGDENIKNKYYNGIAEVIEDVDSGSDVADRCDTILQIDETPLSFIRDWGCFKAFVMTIPQVNKMNLEPTGYKVVYY